MVSSSKLNTCVPLSSSVLKSRPIFLFDASLGACWLDFASSSSNILAIGSSFFAAFSAAIEAYCAAASSRTLSSVSSRSLASLS